MKRIAERVGPVASLVTLSFVLIMGSRMPLAAVSAHTGAAALRNVSDSPAANDAASSYLKCTFYDKKSHEHQGTCAGPTKDGGQYVCVRNGWHKQAQLQDGCKDRVEYVRASKADQQK